MQQLLLIPFVYRHTAVYFVDCYLLSTKFDRCNVKKLKIKIIYISDIRNGEGVCTNISNSCH